MTNALNRAGGVLRVAGLTSEMPGSCAAWLMLGFEFYDGAAVVVRAHAIAAS